LVHTEIKNHSQAFWRRLEEVCPEAPILKNEIRVKAKALPSLI
jgi:predicted metal-dependent hydrolase